MSGSSEGRGGSISVNNNNNNNGSSVSSQFGSESDETSTTPPTPPELADFKSSTADRDRKASTRLISQNSQDMKKILKSVTTPGTQKIDTLCCGGGCCRSLPLTTTASTDGSLSSGRLTLPDNEAFRSLKLDLDSHLTLDSELSNIVALPEKTVSFAALPASTDVDIKLPGRHEDIPPEYVQPHPPYHVYRARVDHARELTKPGAEKRTFHFDVDVTDYPTEGGNVDFTVGGAIGVCPKNKEEEVDDVLKLLGIPRAVRDKRVLLRTTRGRWPTIWGEDEARELITTRRELLDWCSDIQSCPPSKSLLRLLAEYASDLSEKKILMFLASAQGQAAFCELRTRSYVTLTQLLHAFPSCQPPLDHLLSVLNTLMPRFYSLSQDPLVSCKQDDGNGCRRLVEIAVTVAEMDDWRNSKDGKRRTGVGSGYLERLASKVIEAEKQGIDPQTLDLHVPMFRGLMANPLAKRFAFDGPMLLVGAGVGIAPFRGFVQRRLQSANCANKVWVLQGIRDSLLDELYSGEWGIDEEKLRKVVQSRRGQGRYVQEELRNQADLVWHVINALDGRVFVCGSSKGMGEGIDEALIDVAMAKGNLNRDEARLFWQGKRDAGQYITVSFSIRLLYVGKILLMDIGNMVNFHASSYIISYYYSHHQHPSLLEAKQSFNLHVGGKDEPMHIRGPFRHKKSMECPSMRDPYIHISSVVVFFGLLCREFNNQPRSFIIHPAISYFGVKTHQPPR